jgi:hypothetical protein
VAHHQAYIGIGAGGGFLRVLGIMYLIKIIRSRPTRHLRPVPATYPAEEARG